MLVRVAETVGGSDVALWLSQSSTAYPAANVAHLLGLVMLVGGIGLLDLRLAGAFRDLPVAALSRILTPLALVGLALMALSGAVMFAADAVALARSTMFRWKLALIAIALINAAAFRWLWRDRIAEWDASPPLAGRAMAAGSVLLWLVIATAGRMIAYS